MKNLHLLIDILKKCEKKFEGRYYVPECWNSFGFEDYTKDATRINEISVNPYSFFIKAIDACIKAAGINTIDLAAMKGTVDITKSVIYSMFLRMFTAWNHSDETLCGGTFLKAISMLPYLKALKVNLIYLLPVFKYSDVSKKGEIGSPYAIKNIYAIDENLHDDLLGNDKSLVNIEFKAFVEACHALGIRVMVDFVFRTVSRDNDLMVEHPDWFYWIGKEYEKDFVAPQLEGFAKPTVVSNKAIKTMYKSGNLRDYLAWFRQSPDNIDSEKWKCVVAKHSASGKNILELIEETFGITTAPGFADVINDKQPAWSDVTYIRIFRDLHKTARDYVGGDHSPYILYDIAKASIARGEVPNDGLWEYIAAVIPYYQTEFGIDGARIDMGHALPDELNREIVDRVKQNNPDFVLWSEEFNVKNSESPMKNGFAFMTGGLWMTYREFEKSGFYKKLMKELYGAKIPVSSALETPDTPRAAFLYSGKGELELMMAVNYMIPNAVPFFNNGMEVMEIQPMNLGLGNTEKGQFVLPENDPMYGKLAFFDNYKMHWTNTGSDLVGRIMADFGFIKEKYAGLIKLENLADTSKNNKNSKIFVLLYFDKKIGRGIFLLANKAKTSDLKISLSDLLPEDTDIKDFDMIYKTGKFDLEKIEVNKQIQLKSKEYIVGGITNG